jgi:hypothetical protein
MMAVRQIGAIMKISWMRVLLSTVTCTAAALGVGFISGDNAVTFAQPGLLALAIPAAVLGFLNRSVALGAILAIMPAFAGAAGLLLRISPHEKEWLVCVAILGSLGGLVCVVAGALAGYVGECGMKSMNGKPPS